MARSSGPEEVPFAGAPGDSDLCNRILEVDPAIRSAVIVQDAEVSAFASTARSTNVLSQAEFREKIGFWVRIVTEISRQTEPMFGSLESILFVHERLKLVTFPISMNRSIGLSIEKSADANYLIQKVFGKIGPALQG